MALVLIDGIELEARKGETILSLALRNNILIPYYCYHPKLSIVGQCRMCLVEVKGMPKLVTACSTVVAEIPPEKRVDGKYDMVIDTKNKTVKKAQNGILEFILLNHPLDCPICDQAGECKLQEYSYKYGNARSRFVEEKVKGIKRYDIGPHVVFDSERCILCTRCIRFCTEITKTGELGLIKRGVEDMVATFSGKKLDNPYSVCTADICPVGALTFREFRFKERVWFLKSSNSVCPECARGCSVVVQSGNGKILRLLPRENNQINGPWMCDYGRLIFERINSFEKRESPLIKYGNEFRTFSLMELSGKLRERFNSFHGKLKMESISLVSARCTNEEIIAFKSITDAIGLDDALVPRIEWGEDDAIIIKKDRRPNIYGANLLELKITEPNPDLLNLLKGKKAAVIVREDPIGDAPQDKRDTIKKVLSDIEILIVIDDHFSETAKISHFYIPLSGYGQTEGTYINFEGVMQRMVPVIKSKTLPLYGIAGEIISAFGKEKLSADFIYWFNMVKNHIPDIKGKTIIDISGEGLRLGINQ